MQAMSESNSIPAERWNATRFRYGARVTARTTDDPTPANSGLDWKLVSVARNYYRPDSGVSLSRRSLPPSAIISSGKDAAAADAASRWDRVAWQPLMTPEEGGRHTAGELSGTGRRDGVIHFIHRECLLLGVHVSGGRGGSGGNAGLANGLNEIK